MINESTLKNAIADGRRHLKEAEVAEMLKLSKRTLQGWRLKGEGPYFLKLGRSVRYAEATLETWIAVRERGSTSATGPADLSNIHRSEFLTRSLGGDRS